MLLLRADDCRVWRARLMGEGIGVAFPSTSAIPWHDSLRRLLVAESASADLRAFHGARRGFATACGVNGACDVAGKKTQVVHRCGRSRPRGAVLKIQDANQA